MNSNLNENQEEESVKRDKIFDNEYEKIELDSQKLNFSIDPSYRIQSVDETIDEEIIKNQIFNKLGEHEKYKNYIVPGENGEYKKIGKAEINEIYLYLIKSVERSPKIEIFSIMSEIFEIAPDKFYESLSNKFKTELIQELKNRGYLKNFKSLF
jgi:hypothetical protein